MAITSLSVRIPAELKAKLKTQAEKNNHSMNAEIVKRLEESFMNVQSFTPKASKDKIELPIAEVVKIKKILKRTIKELKKKDD